jgi:hypothetical protein
VSDAPAAKPAEPQTKWGRITTATPIVLTVLATAIAGLSSSEMTRSMYFRSVAAQQQSKAADQWNFFQAKRIRGTTLDTSAELLHAQGAPATFDPPRLAADCRALAARLDKTGPEAAEARKAADRLAQLLTDSEHESARRYLVAGLPKAEEKQVDDPEVRKRLDEVEKAIAARQTEAQTVDKVKALTPDQIDAAIQLAEDNADAIDRASKPTSDLADELRAESHALAMAVSHLPKAAAEDARGSAAAIQSAVASAVFDFDARRYKREAAYNRKAGELYEVRVRRSGVLSDVHRERSKQFFYAMLLLQAGVTVSTLALARQRRSALWLLAVVAGLFAMSFTGYTYVAMQ